MANDKNIDKIETSAAEELLEKIQELQEGHAYLKEEMSKLMIAGEHKKSDRQRSNGGGAALDGGGVAGPSAVKLTETHYVNIMQSIGQSVHMFDLNCQIIYWNRMAQNLYGYTVAEALGKTAPDIIIGPEYSALAALIIQRGTMGESWSGEFPVRNKRWERFTVITTVSPSCDESGNINGAICVSTDARPFQELKFGLDPQQPQKMASKVKSKIKTNTDHESRSEDNHYSDIAPFDYKGQSQSGASSSRSTLTNSIIKVGIDIENLDVEILWDDLIIREQIGQGTCGTVYRALWDGSDVAVKVFPTQEYPKDVILSFRKEVCLMKRLRHPNIQLFMGAVTSPHHLCIVTEFLPRGSLFRLLQRNTTKLDWRRRVHMAMDIARGINYLHHCHPPIVHLDLRSSNLLIDKNWTVKVGDFGLSRIKHETYLTTKTGNGTPQWMAPEILRCEQANEKSDVYSYGVVLWEITTENIPWDNLDPTQVIGTVGFMNHRLKIPEGVDPQWASLIESCCSSEPESRPTFHEILTKLKDLQKKFAVQFQTPRRRQKGS